MPLPIYFFKQKNNPKNVLFIPRNVHYKDERKTEIKQGTVNLRLSAVLKHKDNLVISLICLLLQRIFRSDARQE